jgi:hypothetical protein
MTQFSVYSDSKMLNVICLKVTIDETYRRQSGHFDRGSFLNSFHKKMISSTNCISGLFLRQTFDSSHQIPIILPNIIDFKLKVPHNQ